MDHPINNIQWIEAEKLNPNDYNPNVVFIPELKFDSYQENKGNIVYH